MAGTRTAWGTLTRHQVVSAATKIVRAGGYEAMTMRSLASDLGVAPMSLYRHVRDKDDILEDVVDRLLARHWRPSASEIEWEAWTTEAADKLRRFLVTQPAAMHVYLQHPVVSPVAITRMNVMMKVLRHALHDEDASQRAYAAIHTYTIGFAALESSRSRWSPANESPDDLAARLATFTTREQFIDGLQSLIQGVQHANRSARENSTKESRIRELSFRSLDD